MKQLLILINIFFFSVCFAQESEFRYQEEFEDFLSQCRVLQDFNIYNEVLNEENLLDSKENLSKYITFLLNTTYPKVEFNEIIVGEDKSKKIWFAYTSIQNALRKNNMLFIICKSNAKVLLFQMAR